MAGLANRQDDRTLSKEEKDRLEADNILVSDYKQQKLEAEAQKSWDLFYKRNKTHFFKDRHWTTREFEELCESQMTESQVKILEVGCGVGNFLYPLIEQSERFYVYACDFSPRAVQFVKDNPLYAKQQCHAFQCDITCDSLVDKIAEAPEAPESVNIATLIFVLSAINPDKMVAALTNIYQVLRPGGIVLVRDYGLYDHAMLRFAKGHKLAENFYVRQDNTRAYYFSLDKMSTIFKEAGFEQISNEYVERVTENRKEQLCVKRIFIQCKFMKPL